MKSKAKTFINITLMLAGLGLLNSFIDKAAHAVNTIDVAVSSISGK